MLSSVGRAAPLHGVGREFEPLSIHQSHSQGEVSFLKERKGDCLSFFLGRDNTNRLPETVLRRFVWSSINPELVIDGRRKIARDEFVGVLIKSPINGSGGFTIVGVPCYQSGMQLIRVPSKCVRQNLDTA